MQVPHTESGLEAERLDRLIDVGRGLLSQLDLDAVLDRVLETARELTGARYAALGILDERRRELAQFLTRGIDAETHAQIGELPRGRGILGLLISEPKPLRLEDVNTHPRSYGFPAEHPPMRTFLGVPIIVRGEAWGNLYLTEKENGEQFTREDERSCVVLGDWAAIAIDNARLYQRAETRRVELERAVRGFEATSAIAHAVGADPDLERVLELITKRGRALVEARSVVILVEQGDELVVAASAGQIGEGTGSVSPTRSASGEVLRSDRALRVSDVATELREDAEALGVPDARTALLVPLSYRGRPLGVLAAFDRLTEDLAFTNEDEQVLQAFAASAATAVATAHSVERDRLQRTIEAAEHERGRWARELHDETLQGMGALRLMLSRAARLDDIDQVRGSLAELNEYVAREIAGLRSIIADLRPPVLDEVGLKPALQALAERTAASSELRIDTNFDFDEGLELPAEVETTVYRLVQESLTNTVKHSGADSAAVEVAVDDRAITVCVVDSGRGFDPDAITSGFGLAGMRERAALTGGTVRIEPGDPGTVVRAVLPRSG